MSSVDAARGPCSWTGSIHRSILPPSLHRCKQEEGWDPRGLDPFLRPSPSIGRRAHVSHVARPHARGTAMHLQIVPYGRPSCTKIQYRRPSHTLFPPFEMRSILTWSEGDGEGADQIVFLVGFGRMGCTLVTSFALPGDALQVHSQPRVHTRFPVRLHGFRRFHLPCSSIPS